MAGYKVFLKDTVDKDFHLIPKSDLRNIIKKIQQLSNDPRPFGSQKLAEQERYRIRQGDYRILYTIQDKEKTVWIMKVSQRKDAYR